MITVEILAVISTLLCVWFLNKKKTSGWWWSILAASLYGILFIDTELYFQVGLQVVFIAQSVYGLVYWSGTSYTETITVAKNSKILFWGGIVVGIAIVGTTFLELHGYKFDLLDVMTSFIALYATYLLSKKVLQSWLVWIVCDMIMILMFIDYELWYSVGLYGLLMINAIHAYITWNKGKKQFVPLK
jgi:nicotinamide mononucleotide transporter